MDSLSMDNFVDCAHHAAASDDENFPDKKRLVICCDGTWNNSNIGGDSVPTNVSRLSAAVAHKCCTGMPQVVYYHRGAGTEESKTASVLGGLLGLGVKQDIVDCYRFICDNYNSGDEIIIVGFSRGAFTARSVSSMVCSLGFLNRAGLSHVGDIYQDYQSFNEWTSDLLYDPSKHLRAFKVEQLERKIKKEFMDKMERVERRLEHKNIESDERKKQIGAQFAKLYAAYERKLNPAALEKQLENDKKDLFRRMTQMKKQNGQMKFRKMAKAYRGQLSEYQMCLTRRSSMQAQTTFEAVEGRVKAVGVWDTVGSLGIPKLPWGFWQGSRSASELRFASLDIHPNVDHAFHALALDEWRTSFAPTLWNLGPRNNNTQLRQVWFPGCHSNVGGGSDAQQISKIALAWMADQLTSIGVEFSKQEMKRIFRSVPSRIDARPWGLGKITSPDSLATTLPDAAWNMITLPYRTATQQWTEGSTRKPGLYMDDIGKRQLKNTKELVHPSVRVRYLYHGLGLDDAGEWQCKALSGRGWQLMFEKSPPKEDDIRPGRDPNVVDQYKTTTGSVTAVYEQYPREYSAEEKLVKAEQPLECDLKQLDAPKNTWTWRLRHGDRQIVLPEEHIGMWERMYIEINDDMVRWQKMTTDEMRKRWTRGDQIRDMATESVAVAFATMDRIMKTAMGTVFGGPPEKYLPRGYPSEHGYHDFVSWQWGLEPDDSYDSRRISVGSDGYYSHDY
ncbi:hypothetical protein CkaCkLH20_12316 [Colletotrichum karsti]|uniref:T6SS Phospholipase effector Tle1-like catalytic domain-containing protein n=1 Tax=Colletotrichum karsti TaxID=1095194 RepID=A0A9P6HUG1_9PEZI|nr:uncharacterized protein CkaCkLH20_12316 [Colletotrichum karsti]KAF9870230.1 hypothetical protein CkaCkLH20_12316 [Colletotrichum karsti]